MVTAGAVIAFPAVEAAVTWVSAAAVAMLVAGVVTHAAVVAMPKVAAAMLVGAAVATPKAAVAMLKVAADMPVVVVDMLAVVDTAVAEAMAGDIAKSRRT
jgi:hypothetical protein